MLAFCLYANCLLFDKIYIKKGGTFLVSLTFLFHQWAKVWVNSHLVTTETHICLSITVVYSFRDECNCSVGSCFYHYLQTFRCRCYPTLTVSRELLPGRALSDSASPLLCLLQVSLRVLERGEPKALLHSLPRYLGTHPPPFERVKVGD